MSNKSLLESALIEAQQIEETVKSNAKEILASTMKEEIEELVKESLSNNGLRKQKVIKEQELEAMVDDEEVIDIDDEEDDDEMEDVLAMADEVDAEEIPSPEGEDEFEPLDLTQASDDDVLKVFKAMGAEDGVIVKQDDDVISIEDEGTGEEYRIELEESKKRIKEDPGVTRPGEEKLEDEDKTEMDEGADAEMKDIDIEAGDIDNEGEEEEAEVEYQLTEDEYESDAERGDVDKYEYEQGKEAAEEQMYEIDMETTPEGDLEERWGSKKGEDPRVDVDGVEKERKDYMEEDSTYGKGTDDIPTGDRKKKGHYGRGGKRKETAREEGESDFQEMWRGNNLGQKVHAGNRSNKYNKAARKKAGINMKESKRSIRNRFINERKRMAGTKVLTETIDNLKGEVNVLKSKNGEYKKALVMFRDKLNEVAVFNSNLAYATKLFTEHTTNKSEKINILRRFDSVESLKESKALYKNMKKQLSSSTKSAVKESLENKNSKKTVQLSESVQKKITKAPVTGASNLIESRTYVDPQIARSLDIMSKIK